MKSLFFLGVIFLSLVCRAQTESIFSGNSSPIVSTQEVGGAHGHAPIVNVLGFNLAHTESIFNFNTLPIVENKTIAGIPGHIPFVVIANPEDISGGVPPGGTTGQVLTKLSNDDGDADWQSVAGTGTVTSVGLSAPSFLSVSGSPVTSSGTIALSLANQSANAVMAGPSTGSPAAPTFRALTSADIPWPLVSQTNGSASAPAFNVGTGGDNDTGIYTTGDGNLSMSANGFLRFQIDQNETTVTGPLIVTGNISAANYPPTGTANRLTKFDNSGDIASSAWQLGLGDELYLNITAPSGADPFRPFYMDVTNAATADGSLVAIGVNTQSDATTSITLIDLNQSGDAGSDIFGARVFNSGNASDGIQMVGIGNSGDFTAQLRLIEASNGGEGPGGILINAFNNASMSGDFQLFGLGDSGNHSAGNFQGISLNKNGDQVGNVALINATLDGDATDNVTLATFGVNNTHEFGSSFTGLNIYTSSNSTDWSTMINVNDAGDSDGKTGVGVFISGDSDSFVNGVSIGLSGSAGTNMTGLNVDVSSATVTNGYPKAINANGISNIFANIEYNGSFSVPIPLQVQILGSSVTIDSGSTTNTFAFASNLASLLMVESDFDDNVSGLDLGWTSVAFVGQIGVASGATLDAWNGALAGAGVMDASSGGTVDKATMFRAEGFLPGAGTIVVNEMYGFKAGSILCLLATDCFGVYIADDSAKNYFAGEANADKGFRLSTSGSQPTCDASTRGLMWNIEGGAGVADIFQVCQKDASDNYVWVTK